jgi:phospholipid/cholesterol/gamma-HCH transport system substrate-binding protein
MSWLGTPEFKVGVLVVAVSGVIGAMSLKLSEGPGVFGRKKSNYFVVDDAGGLVKKGLVKMAGIKVGVIDDIELVDGKAKVTMALEPSTDVTGSTRVEMKTDGILGDKHVELIPGKPGEPPLEKGTQIPLGGNAAGLDDLMVEAKKVAVALNDLLGTLNKAAKEGDPNTPIGRIIMNVENLTADLKDISHDNKAKVNEIVEKVRNITKNFDTYINEESLARIDRSLQNVEEITDKVNKGEGTLGRLINDDKTVDELNTAIENVNKFLGTANKLETSIDFHSEYLNPLGASKSFIGLRLQPGLDRYYEVYAIDDPRGLRTTTVTQSQPNPPAGPVSTEQVTTIAKNSLKFTALFAKNFYDFTIKGGLIESSGGFGFDYHLFNRKLTLSTEFFNFQSIYVRAFAKYQFVKGVYAVAGGDNLMRSDQSTANMFVGAGIFITNDDLKLLAARLAF